MTGIMFVNKVFLLSVSQWEYKNPRHGDTVLPPNRKKQSYFLTHSAVSFSAYACFILCVSFCISQEHRFHFESGLPHTSSATLSRSLRVQWNHMYKALRRTHNKCSINVSFTVFYMTLFEHWILPLPPSLLWRGSGHKDQNPYESFEGEEWMWAGPLWLLSWWKGKTASAQRRQNQ